MLSFCLFEFTRSSITAQKHTFFCQSINCFSISSILGKDDWNPLELFDVPIPIGSSGFLLFYVHRTEPLVLIYSVV